VSPLGHGKESLPDCAHGRESEKAPSQGEQISTSATFVTGLSVFFELAFFVLCCPSVPAPTRPTEPHKPKNTGGLRWVGGLIVVVRVALSVALGFGYTF
jgi:hypothetical protein